MTNYLCKIWHLTLVLILTGICFPTRIGAQTTRHMWVGESFECDASSAVIGLTSDVSWSQSGGYVQLSGSGMYRKATITQYFSGTATVKCTWKYRLYANDTWKTQSRTWTFACNDNPISISPTSMTLSVGEQAYIGYSLAYTTNASSAQTTFGSSNSRIASVTGAGLVTAEAPGTAYINVYSKVSANTPYCIVTVRKIPVEKVSIPTNINVEAGKTAHISLKLTPANGTVSTTVWQNTNPSVATINANGTIQAIRPGTTSISCIVNGNVYSNTTKVTVTPATLQLTADPEGGFLAAGTAVTLKASDPDAEIYYTTDGSDPTKTSSRYTEPIVINHSLTLKAQAMHTDYYPSKVLTCSFKTTSLNVISTYPEMGTKGTNQELIPSITFSKPIRKSTYFSRIKLQHTNSNDSVDGHAIITDNTLFYVTDKRLSGGSYTLNVPTDAVKTVNDEANFGFDLKFTTQADAPKASQIYSGNGTAYMLDSNGDLWAWGSPVYGPFGNNQKEPVLTPVKILEDVALIRNGKMSNIFAIKKNGDLYCWGLNNYGQVGDGTTSDKLAPVKVLSGVKDVALGYFSTYALKNDGTLWAWGQGEYGALGNNRTTDSHRPIKILDRIKAVSADYYHAFAIRQNGDLLAWGYNLDGQLGIGIEQSIYLPSQVVLNQKVTDVLANGNNTYAITEDGSLWAWGSNTHGALGINTTQNALTPRKVTDNVMSMADGIDNIWIIKKDSSLWAWGRNEYGQLGTGNTEDVRTPLKIMDHVKKVSSGYATAVIQNDHSMWVCGRNNYGQLGNHTFKDRYTFEKFSRQAVDVSLKTGIGACITPHGSLWTWGAGYLGNGTDVGSLSPTRVFPIANPPYGKSVLSTDKLEIPQGGEAVIQLLCDPITAPVYTSWVSSDYKIAHVTDRGVVKGIAPGTTKITVYIVEFIDSPILSDIYTCDVTVSEATTNIETVKAAPLNIRIYDGRVWINGVAEGETIWLYDTSGRLCDETRSTGHTACLNLNSKGLYIVRTSDGRTAKVMFSD